MKKIKTTETGREKNMLSAIKDITKADSETYWILWKYAPDLLTEKIDTFEELKSKYAVFADKTEEACNKYIYKEDVQSGMPTKNLPVSVTPILRKYSRNMSIWMLPVKGKRYYIGVDTGEGLGGSNDYSVISIINSEGFQCLEWRSNKVKPYEFTEIVFQIARLYNNALLVIEKASAGHTVLDKIKHDYHYVNIFKSKSYDQKTGRGKRKIGWETTMKSKPIIINDMQEAFETGQCLVNSKDLLNGNVNICAVGKYPNF